MKSIKRGTVSEKLHALFYDPTAKGFYLINDILAFATIASVLSIILETVSSLESYTTLFNIVEYTSLILFTLEYIGRILANKKRVRTYTLSFFGIIDLLAIVPSFLGLSNLTFLKTARVLRILRLLRMARLAKLAKTPRKHTAKTDEDISTHTLSVQIYFAALLTAVIISGTLVYLVEESLFTSIPDGMLWALKATLRIPPTKMPITMLGEAITALTYFFGLLLFGLLISVMGNSLKKLLLGEKNK